MASTAVCGVGAAQAKASCWALALPTRSGTPRGSRVGPSRRRTFQVVARSPGSGGGVMDRPTTAPDINKGREKRRFRPPSYRLLLHNDNYNKREYVVSVLLKVVEGYSVDDAVNVMQEAHSSGLALVTQCAQEVAERYCESMRNSGLIASIEPAGPGPTN